MTSERASPRPAGPTKRLPIGQGARLAELQELRIRYWGTDYDWRKAEAQLNAFPQSVTTIDGVDIYFIHVRSRQPNALPLIVSHGSGLDPEDRGSRRAAPIRPLSAGGRTPSTS